MADTLIAVKASEIPTTIRLGLYLVVDHSSSRHQRNGKEAARTVSARTCHCTMHHVEYGIEYEIGSITYWIYDADADDAG